MTHHIVSRHHPHLKYLDRKELSALYWSVFIKGIGDSFISIFTAIYLLSLGFALRDVAIFYILYFLMLAMLARTAMHLAKLCGIKKTLALGTGLLAIYYFFLTLVGNGFPYWIVGLLYGSGASFYWTAFQLDLAGALRTRSSGSSLSNVKSLTIAAGIVGPIIGALLIVNSSFSLLFVMTGLVFGGSLIPLIRRGDYKLKEAIPGIRESLRVDKPRKALMYGLYGATESAIDILWPVFLFMAYPNLLSVGGIVSITSLLMLIVFYIVGRFADRNPIDTYRAGALLHAPTWVLRLLWLTPGGLLLGNFLGSATSAMVAITVDRTMYRDMKQADLTMAVLLFRNYHAAIGRIAALIFAAILNDLKLMFIVLTIIILFQIWCAPRYRSTQLNEQNKIS